MVLCLWKIILWTFTAQFENLANSSMDLPLPASTSQYLVSSSRTPSNTGPCLTAYTIDILEYHLQEQTPAPRSYTKRNKISHINKCAKTQTCPASMANFSVLSKNRASSVSSVASRCFATNLNLKIDPYDIS